VENGERRRKMVALRAVTVDIGESSDFSLGCTTFAGW
jgi:hypothetical protein